MYFYIYRHRPVGDRFDLFRVGSYVMFAHDAAKKWYFASRKYILLEVGIQLMLAHECKSYLEVESV